MARRTLVDIDGKMIQAAIKIGGEKGIDRITSRKVAELCDVTDPLIFVHYGTMENLINCAFKTALDTIMDGIEKLEIGGVDKWEANFDELVRWHRENAGLTQFLYNVINSEYGFNVPEKLQAFFGGANRPLIAEKNSGVSDKDMYVYYYMTYQHFLHFVTRIIRGDMEYNKANKAVAMKLILGGYKL